MANEIQFNFKADGSTYFVVRNRIGQIWNTASSAFENYVTATYTDYDIAATEQGTSSGYYAGTFPSAIVPGIYSITAKEQLGGSPAETDPTIAAGDFQWSGTTTLPLSDLATSGQVGQFAPIRLARGEMVLQFPFKLVSAADHVTPFTSGICSGQISRDGGNFGALQSGAFSEKGLGFYTVQALTSGDLNCNTVALTFTANGISGGTSDSRDYVMVLQRTSGN